MGFKAFLTDYLFFFYLAAALIGFLVHDLSSLFESWIPWMLFLIMYFSTLKIDAKTFIATLVSLKSQAIMLIIYFIAFPLAAYFSSLAIFGSSSVLVAGTVFLFTLPAGITNVLYTNLFRGDSSFTLSALITTSLLSPLATPLAFYLLTKNIIEFSFLELFLKIILIVIVPFLLAVLTQKTPFYSQLKKDSDFFASFLYIMINFAAAGVIYNSGILQSNSLLALIIFLIGAFFSSFFLVYYVAKRAVNREYAISLALLTTRRNTTLGMGIASGTLGPVFVTISLMYQYVHDISSLFLRRFFR